MVWGLSNKALRMREVSGIEHELTLSDDMLSLTVVDHGRCEKADAGVAVLMVVPGEELLGERPSG